jgi:hypothetical protein
MSHFLLLGAFCGLSVALYQYSVDAGSKRQPAPQPFYSNSLQRPTCFRPWACWSSLAGLAGPFECEFLRIPNQEMKDNALLTG